MRKNKNIVAYGNQRGMTLFIAIIIMSILLFISFAVVNIAIKGTLFASSGRDSQFAFYAADAGMECALYWDARSNVFTDTEDDSEISCAGIATNPNIIRDGDEILGTTTITVIGEDLGVPAVINRVGTPVNANPYPVYWASSISTPATSVTAGNFIVVGVTYFKESGQSINTVRDNASGGGNSYTRATTVTAGNPGYVNEIWYAKDIKGNNSNVITVTFSSSVRYLSLTAAEYSGIDTVSPLDTTAISTTQTGITVTSDPFTTIRANELIIGYAQVSAAGQAWTPGVNFLTRKEDEDRMTLLEDRIVTQVQTNITANATVNISSPKTITIATFKAGLTGGSGGSATKKSVFGFIMNDSNNANESLPYCAIVEVNKNSDGTNSIYSRGYNTCENSTRRIERGIQVNY